MLAHTAQLPIFPGYHSQPKEIEIPACLSGDPVAVLVFESFSRRRGFTMVNLSNDRIFIGVSNLHPHPQWVCEPSSSFYMPVPVYTGNIFAWCNGEGGRVSVTEFFCEE